MNNEPQCGNPKHPQGPWHPATSLPIPGYRGWGESVVQWFRRKVWGCSCADLRS